jgi:Tannase and feruloyl esterase
MLQPDSDNHEHPGRLAVLPAFRGAPISRHHAPRELLAAKTDAGGNVVATRPVCMYPLVARYKGHGSVDEASRFVCRKSFGPKAG